MEQASALAVIGGGTMGRAIVQGARGSGSGEGLRIWVAEPDYGLHREIAGLGVPVVQKAAEAVRALPATSNGQILLAVKPQSLVEVGAELAPVLQSQGVRRVVISILAGTPTEKVKAALGGQNIVVVRAMPNTPAQIGMGATALALGVGTTEEDAGLAEQLFRALGPLVLRIDESLMDAWTAVAGSGPAYLFYLAQAMVEAAVAVGFDQATAAAAVRATVAGAAALLTQKGQSPAQLLAAVKSKGGTTEAAAAVLDSRGVRQAVIDAITAARDRGRELGR